MVAKQCRVCGDYEDANDCSRCSECRKRCCYDCTRHVDGKDYCEEHAPREVCQDCGDDDLLGFCWACEAPFCVYCLRAGPVPHDDLYCWRCGGWSHSDSDEED